MSQSDGLPAKGDAGERGTGGEIGAAEGHHRPHRAAAGVNREYGHTIVGSSTDLQLQVTNLPFFTGDSFDHHRIMAHRQPFCGLDIESSHYRTTNRRGYVSRSLPLATINSPLDIRRTVNPQDNSSSRGAYRLYIY